MTALADSDFEFLRTLLLRHGGLQLDRRKGYMVTTRLMPVARRHGLADVGELVARLRQDDPALQDEIVDAMTINETSFFRDPAMWRALRDQVLPELLERRATLRSVNIWCAACSSGQEPYSLAITLAEMLGADLGAWHLRLFCTDLSAEMVDRTARGAYSDYELGRGLSPERRQRFFRPTDDGWVADDRLRALITTRKLDLTAQPLAVQGSYDLVLLRNALIYFTPETRSLVLDGVARKLASSGRLVLGASEGASGIPARPDPGALQRLRRLRARYRCGGPGRDARSHPRHPGGGTRGRPVAARAAPGPEAGIQPLTAPAGQGAG